MKNYDLPTLTKSYINGLRALMETEAKKGVDFRPIVFDIEKADKLEDRDVSVGGVEGLEEWKEGERAKSTEFIEGFPTVYKQIEFGREIPVGRHFAQFTMNDLSTMQKQAVKIGNAAYRSIQKRAYEVLSRGVDSTFDHGYGDGKRVFSALRPLSPEDATTYSNIITSSPVPGYDGLMEAFDLLDAMPDDRGEELGLGDNGYEVITADFSDYIALSAILDTDAELDPRNANNTLNTMNGKLRGFSRPITVKYVRYAKNATYPHAYYVMAKESEKPFQILEANPFMTDEYVDDASKTRFVRGSVMYDRKMKNPRLIVASLGDGSTSVNW